MEQKKSTRIFWIVGASVVAIVVALGAYIFFFTEKGNEFKIFEKPRVIGENLAVPNTKEITGVDGRFGSEGSINVPILPKSGEEKVVVSKAVLTVKGSYVLAVFEAQKWSADAKLVMVRSLGAVTIDGKSSQWQLAFSSASKKGKGYEIIIQADQIISQKEIGSTVGGADLPINFKDSDKAIVVLQELPEYSEATISSISLYYNTDGKFWRYTLATSRGATSVAAQ